MAAVKDPIGEAVKYAEEVDFSYVEELEFDVADMKARKSSLESKELGLLGVEQDALHSIRNERELVSRRMAEKEKDIAQMKFAEEHGFPRLSREPLLWRKDGMPMIVPFSIDHGHIQISVDEFGRTTVGPDRVRWLIGDTWNDLVFQKPTRGKRHLYVARFKGVLPKSVREKTTRWARSELFLFSEAQEWTFTEEMAPTYDPLLVLQKHGALWLLDKFDATPVEEYIADEFTA